MQMGMRGTYETVYLPNQLDSLFYWYAADAGVLDSLGGDISDGEKVSSWTDFSGRGHNVTQATGGAMPTFRAAGGPNGWPCIEFDGTDDFLASAAHFWGSDDLTIIVVMKFANATRDAIEIIVTKAEATTPANVRQWQFQGRAAAASYSRYLYVFNDGSIDGKIIMDGAKNPTYELLTVLSNGLGTSYDFFVNGVSTSPTQSGFGDWTVLNNDDSPITIGAANTLSTPSAFLQGSISEIIVFSRALTTDERVGVEQYLKAKYSL